RWQRGHHRWTLARRRLRRRRRRCREVLVDAPALTDRDHATAHRAPRAHTREWNLGRIDAKDGAALGTGDVHALVLTREFFRSSLGDAHGRAENRILPTINDVDGSIESLRIALHLGCQLTHLRGVTECSPLVRHDADAHRHERNAMQLSAPVLAEIISRLPILFGILIGHEQIENGDDLLADLRRLPHRHEEDEVVATNMSDEAAFWREPTHN